MNTRLKCLLLDDEIPGLTLLKLLCDDIPEVEVLKACDRAETFLEEMKRFKPDFVILDIHMPGTNGLEIAKMISGTPVIFTTAYKEYAVEAFGVEAVDYVCKPVTRDSLLKAIAKLQRLFQRIKPEEQRLRFQTDKGIAFIEIMELDMVRTSELDSRDKVAKLASGSTYTLKNVSFEKLMEQLPSKDFARVNKQQVIALRTVKRVSSGEVVVADRSTTHEYSVALSETYRKDLIRKLQF